jgi:adenylate kinase family enzyme
MRALTHSFAVVLLCLAGGAAYGASSSGKGTLAYKWIDEHGVVHYGDTVPPQYANSESSMLNKQGVEVKRTDALKTPEQLADDARKQQEYIRQKQHDAFLLTTYTSVKDIESLRDERLDQVGAQRRAAEQYVEGLHSRLSALQTRALGFKPYNEKNEARRMPDDLAEDLMRTLNEMRVQKTALGVKDAEETAMRADFQADIDRYRELHAIRQNR